jgi:ADP-ribose pyrophosphatase YjhB (NUDIX family)
MMPQPKFVPKPGQIDYTNIRRAPVVQSVVMHRNTMLLLRRSENLEFYPGFWSGVSGFLDEPSKTVEEKLKEELNEELGIEPYDVLSMEKAAVIEENDKRYGKVWVVHPMLVRVGTKDIRLDWEAED